MFKGPLEDEGRQLALVIRRQFSEMDDFREAMSGRSVNVRFGSQGSVIDWLIVPRLSGVRAALGKAIVEMEQMRSADVVRSVEDGRLDFGIVREDAVPAEMKRWQLGAVGYSLFATKAHWKGRTSMEKLIERVPIAALEGLRHDVLHPFVILIEPEQGKVSGNFCQAWADEAGYVCEIRLWNGDNFRHFRSFLRDAQGGLGEEQDPQLPNLSQAIRFFTGFMTDHSGLPVVDDVEWLDVSDDFKPVPA